jgi:two-component system, cell cycle sensor histidine kinase and response regulator CckA
MAVTTMLTGSKRKRLSAPAMLVYMMFLVCLPAFVLFTSAAVTDLTVMNLSHSAMVTGSILSGLGMFICILMLIRTVSMEHSRAVRHLHHIMRTGGLGCWTCQYENDRLDLDETAWPILGLPAGSIDSPEAFIRLVHPDDRAGVRNLFSQTTPGSRLAACRFIPPAGKMIWIEIIAEPPAGKADSEGICEGVIRDITALKTREMELERTITKTDHALKLADMVEWELDLAEYRILIMEPFATRLFLKSTGNGFGLDEFFSRIDREFRDTVVQRLTAKDAADDKPLDLEFRFNRIDGDFFYLKFYGTHLRDSTGRIIKRFGLAQDISRLRETEQALEESEKEKNLVIDTIHLGLALWTPERRLIWANRKIFELFGAEHSDKIHNELCYRLLRPNCTTCTNCPVLEALQRRQPITQEMDIAGKILSVSAVPFIDRYGEITRIITMVHDISYQKKQQQQLYHTEKMEAVRSLAAGIAQDFNNLLQVIMHWVELSRDSSDTSTHYNLENIISAVQKGHDLTNQLLTFSGMDTAFQPQSVSVIDFLNRFADDLKQRVSDNITVTITIDPDLPSISADVKLLENMLNALFINAEEAMETGGRLHISASEIDLTEQIYVHNQMPSSGRYVRLSIADTGTGITESEMNRIFNPFFTTKTDRQNRGMGLPKVYSEMRRHNGYIQVDSDEGKGTEISLCFPVPSNTTLDTAELLRLVKKDHDSDSVNILLVDDDPTVRKLTLRTLEKHGFNLIEAADGQTAIDLFTQHSGNIHLVLLDVILPRRSGREVYDHIKQVQPNTRVIFATGYSASYLDDLPNDAVVIQKPFTKTALLQTVKLALAGILS